MWKAFGSSKCLGDMVCYDACTPPKQQPAIASFNPKDWFEQEKAKFDDKVNAFKDKQKERFEKEVAVAGEKARELLENAAKFKDASVRQLKAVSQDLLAHSKNVAALTAKKLGELTAKLKEFTPENLKSFLDNAKPEELKKSMKEFACVPNWTDDQVVVLAKKAGQLFGDVTGWDKEQFQEMGNLVKGITEGDLDNIKPLAFKSAALALSVTLFLPRSKSEATVRKAKAVFGEVKSWDRQDWETLGKVAVGLTKKDLKEVTREGLLFISRVGEWDNNQTRAIAERTYEILGKEDAALAEDDWQMLARYAKGIAAGKLKKASASGLEALGKLTSCDEDPLIKSACLEDGQLEALLESAKDKFGETRAWTKETVGKLGHTLKGLTKEDIAAMTKEGLAATLDSAEKLKDLAFDKEKRAALAAKAKEAYSNAANSSKCWIKDAADKIGSVLDSVDSSAFDCVGDAETLFALGKSKYLELSNTDEAKAVKAAIKDKAVAVLGEPSTWKATAVEKLGGLVKTLEAADIKKLSADALAALAAKVQDIDQEQVDAVLARAEEVAGDVKTWSAEQWQKFGKIAAPLAGKKVSELTEDDLYKVAAVAKEVYAEDLKKVRAKITELAKDKDLANLTKEQAAKLKKLAMALTPDDLEQLSEQALEGLVESMDEEAAAGGGAACPDEDKCSYLESVVGMTESYCLEQVEALLARAKEFDGDLETWGADKFKKYKALLRGMTAGDIASLKEQGLAAVKELQCLDTDRLKCLANRGKEIVKKAKGVGTAAKETWEQLGSLAKGLGLEDFADAPVKELMAKLSEIEWSPEQAAVLVDKLKAEYGDDVAKWADDVKAKVGTMMAGFDKDDVKALGTKAFELGSASMSQAVQSTLCASKSLHFLTEGQMGALSKSLQKRVECDEESQFFTAGQLAAAQGSEVIKPVVDSVTKAGDAVSFNAGDSTAAAGGTTVAEGAAAATTVNKGTVAGNSTVPRVGETTIASDLGAATTEEAQESGAAGRAATVGLVVASAMAALVC
jgi:phage FluMu protein gp41